MKLLLIGSVCLLIGVMGGVVICRNWQEKAPAPAPADESTTSPARDESLPEKIIPPRQERAKVVLENTNAAKVPLVTAAPSTETKSATSTFLSRSVDTLVSTNASLQQKQEVWKQLRESGQLDEAIEALKQGATNNPTSAVYPTVLGQAELQKAYVLSKSGGSVNEMGIAGMQADQYFDSALKLDPSNWDAQFSKAVSMSYWPPELNKGPEVIQRLGNLINQQETMPSQPQFAMTYVILGDQYQKAGQPDYAQQTWQLGATQFPGDPTLQKKIAGSRGQ